MIFNSIIYLLFLAIVAIVYYIFPGKLKWLLLLLASIGYYLSFIPIFLLLLAVIVFVNYFMAIWLANANDGRSSLLIVLIIILNILILAFFKYFNNLFPDNQLQLYSVALFPESEPVDKMILPLGLSYLTFTVLSYQIEVKRKTIQPETHLGYFSLYLLFFPRIAQGPIERPQHLIPQLHQDHHFNYSMVIEGLKLMLWGYFKKLVIADRLGIYVNAVYNNSENHNGTSFIVATIFFAFQIYADFSGYTDIAIGSARLFGFNLSNNFKRPYFATSIKEFWNRWHISFSTWLRDYIFLPLAYFLSNRMKKQRYLHIATEKWIYLIAIIVTFAICGIWHGVGWTYLIWGVLFGLYLTYANWTKDFYKKIRKRFKINRASPYYITYQILSTFILVLLAWIFFRADSLSTAFYIVKSVFTFSGDFFIDYKTFIYGFTGILILIYVEYCREFRSEGSLPFLTNNWIKEVFLYGSLIIIIMLVGVFDGSQFIYFQY